MGVWEAAMWGSYGGFAVEGLVLIAEARRIGGWPWSGPDQLPARVLVLAIVIRVGIGAGLAAAAFSSEQITTAFAAISIGAGANKIIEGILGQVPLDTPAPPAVEPAGADPPLTPQPTAPSSNGTAPTSQPTQRRAVSNSGGDNDAG
ncbi:hypothetical protein [Frankia sp. ACN1ag]|uniref:hypothetical protein n=1 Tax=Frankia sp. ACN1ag TaxID=102891 RepID=UPI00128EA73E|nr:hypothetical protein [Frankia sp. ACN1ag]